MQDCNRQTYLFKGLTINNTMEDAGEEEYNLCFYIKSNWKPPPVVRPYMVRKRIDAFKHELSKGHKLIKEKCRKRGNLPSHMFWTAQTLQENNDLVISMMDKSQGLCATETTTYNR